MDTDPQSRRAHGRGHGSLAFVALLSLLSLPVPLRAQDPPAIELDTLRVEVTSRASSLAAATRAVQVLEGEWIRHIPAQNLADLVAWVMGADVLSRSSAQVDVAVRGSTFEQVLVLVDDVRMNDAQTGHFHWNLAVPLEEIERIEVLRGAGSSLYGSDAMGGVIRIVTRGAGGDTGVEAGLSAGSFVTAGARFAAGASARGVGSRVSAELQRTDGHRPGTDARTMTGRAGVQGQVAGGPLRGDVGLAVRDFGARHFYTSPTATFDEFERTRAATASLRWQTPASGHWSLEPTLSLRRHYDEFLLQRDDPGFYRNVHTSTQVGGSVAGRVVPAAGTAVSMGVETYRDVLESTNLGYRSETRAAAFTELALGRVGVGVVHLGLRGDHHSAFGGFLAPSAAAALWAGAVKVRASGGRSFRAPNWTERYYLDLANEGDPHLRPETAWSAEVGVDVLGPDATSLGVTAFIRAARDLIDWARPRGAGDEVVWRTMNVGRAVFRGGELEARATDDGGTRWSAQVSLLRSFTGDDGWDSKYALRPLTRSVALSAARPLVGGQVSLRARHARRAGDPAYTTVDARLSRPVNNRLRIELDVVNLTNKRFLDVTGLDGPGRAVYLRAGWR